MPNIDEQIDQAMRDGKFDNLSGAGKPLKWDDDLHADPEWALANHILKSSGYTLPWIETRQYIVAELAKARQALASSWAWRQDALVDGQVNVEVTWQRAVSVFTEQIAAVNKRIITYNLEIPDARFELPLCNAQQEISDLKSR